jgi:hypothetical protein
MFVTNLPFFFGIFFTRNLNPYNSYFKNLIINNLKANLKSIKPDENKKKFTITVCVYHQKKKNKNNP